MFVLWTCSYLAFKETKLLVQQFDWDTFNFESNKINPATPCSGTGGSEKRRREQASKQANAALALCLLPSRSHSRSVRRSVCPLVLRALGLFGLGRALGVGAPLVHRCCCPCPFIKFISDYIKLYQIFINYFIYLLKCMIYLLNYLF